MRIGSVPYLNAKPLVEWFHTADGKRSGVEVEYDVPSRLAQRVQTEELSCALASSIELLRQRNWVAAPGVAIASTGSVLSVRLFSKVPFSAVRTVALDTGSLTSSALVQVLFARCWNAQPRYFPFSPDLKSMLRHADAALLIGDKGMLAPDEGLYVADLGEEWYRWTGLPFVWALWLGREGSMTPELVNVLLEARRWGLQHLEHIAQLEAVRLGVDEVLVKRYLCNIMQYEVTPAHEEGLMRFGQECRALGLVSMPTK